MATISASIASAGSEGELQCPEGDLIYISIEEFGTSTVQGDTPEAALTSTLGAYPALDAGSFRRLPDQASGRAAFDADSCPALADAEKNAIHWGSISTNAFAKVVLCTFADAGGADNAHIHSFQMKVNKDAQWYTGIGSPVCNPYPNCQGDALSVAVHEFGHATGRAKSVGGPSPTSGDASGHFYDSWDVCSGSPHHTMCQSGIGGSTVDRTLEQYDKDVFNGAYGPR